MRELKLNGMRELNFKEVEEVSGGWFFTPWVLKAVGGTLIGTLGINAIFGGKSDGPRGPTPAGPRRR